MTRGKSPQSPTIFTQQSFRIAMERSLKTYLNDNEQEGTDLKNKFVFPVLYRLYKYC